MTKEIPDIVIGRLPIYLRELTSLQSEGEKTNTSSHDLGRRLGISSAQIRKDFSHFGEFGKQGTGYNISYLVEQLSEILHLTKEWRVAIVGAGFLGHALAHYNGFQHRGFRVLCVFDSDPEKIGTQMGEFIVQSIDELETTIQQSQVEVTILAVPISVVQDITDRLVTAGVKALLSYVPVQLTVPDGIQVSYSDPVVQMQRMTYYLNP